MSRLTCCVFAVILLSVILNNVASAENVCDHEGIKFKKGESISVPGKCMKLTCEDPANNAVSGLICPAFQTGPKCHASETDYKKPYPDCCPKPIC